MLNWFIIKIVVAKLICKKTSRASLLFHFDWGERQYASLIVMCMQVLDIQDTPFGEYYSLCGGHARKFAAHSTSKFDLKPLKIAYTLKRS